MKGEGGGRGEKYNIGAMLRTIAFRMAIVGVGAHAMRPERDGMGWWRCDASPSWSWTSIVSTRKIGTRHTPDCVTWETWERGWRKGEKPSSHGDLSQEGSCISARRLPPAKKSLIVPSSSSSPAHVISQPEGIPTQYNLQQYMDLSSLYSHQTPMTRSKPSKTKPSTTMSHTAFFYGTLMAPPVLHRVIWGCQTPPTPAHTSLLKIRPAILHAHQRRKVKQADYPAVLPAKPTSSVRGTLVEGLTDGDIWRLDIFEGSEYQRRSVKVRILESTKPHNDVDDDDDGETVLGEVESQGAEIEAETYLWIAGAKRLEAEEWDFDEFVREKMKRWVDSEVDDGFRGRRSVDGAGGVPRAFGGNRLTLRCRC